MSVRISDLRTAVGATIILLCFLVPLVAGADTLDVYGLLTGKTVLAPSALPVPPDSAVPDPLTDKTNAIATIERAFLEKGIEIMQDGPYFVRLVPRAARDFLTNAPLRGAELAALETAEPGGSLAGEGVFPLQSL